MLYSLPKLDLVCPPIPINGISTATLAPDGMPNHIFFAMDQQSQFCIKVMGQGVDITHPNAH